MTTYYVATLACYVLVEAKDETEAREKGHAALRELYAELRQRSTNDEVPIEIRIVRESRETTAFSYVQSVDDWSGALWSGRGGAIGEAFGRFFRPGSVAPEGPAGTLGSAPPPQAMEMLERLDGSIRLVVTDEPGADADWSVTLRLGQGPVPDEPTCSIAITAADATALSRGELDPMQAFMGGKMVVTGDMTLMLQMQAVLMQAAQDQGEGQS